MLTMDQQLMLAKKSYDGIIAQGRRSFHDGICAYRTPEGLKCGIGHLISDDMYDKNLETHGVRYIKVMAAVEKSQKIALDKDLKSGSAIYSETVDAKFLSALQQVHDNAAEQHTNKAFLTAFISGFWK